jgi:predicted DNA binding protein
MTVVDAHVRVHHPCPYCDISAEFPRTLLLLWCDNRRDVFLVSAPDPAELRRVTSALRDAFHARSLVVDGKDALVSVPDFEWASPPSVTGLARKSGVWVLHPVVYFEGTETYRLVSPTKGELNQLITRVRRLGDVEILSVSERSGLDHVRESPTATVHFFEGLTDRQARALVAAYEGGLFDVPAKNSWSAVARSQGVSRSTFGEHLRKGQLRLLANSQAPLKSRIEDRGAPLFLRATGSERREKRTPLQGTRAA